MAKLTNSTPWFYQGPYVPSGVIYGEREWASRSIWLVPGYDPDSTAIDMYEPGRAALAQGKAKA